MCPFEAILDLNTLRAELIALWYDEQRLRAQAEQADRDRAALLAQVEQLTAQVGTLQAKLSGTRAKGSKNRSERRPRNGTNNAPPKTGAPQKGHGPTEQPHLEQQDKVYDVDEADKVCTTCGGALEAWEGHDDHTVLIEVIERRFVCQNITQKKYRCRCGNCIETAIGPERLMPGGRYSVSFAIEVAHDKYMLHSPLERQAREMTRQGLVIDSQTLWDQTWALSRLLLPAYEAVHRYVLSGRWVAADETTWWMLRHQHSRPELEHGEWYIWIAHRTDAAFYLIRPKRDDKAAKELLSLPILDANGVALLDHDGQELRLVFSGKVMCDGWWAYKYLAKHHAGVVLAHCWSHVRREFLPCEKSFPKQTAALLDLIAELYLIERQAPEGAAGDAERARLRQTKSAAVLERIGGWVYTHALLAPPESDLRKAAGYLVNHWVGLTRFVDDAELPLDNNGVEKDCRQSATGKKNHYGSRSERGAEAAAIHYTLVQTAKLSGIEPKTYLRVAALRELRGKSVLLPHEVKAEHLREELGLSEAEIERVLARRHTSRTRAGPEPVTGESAPPP